MLCRSPQHPEEHSERQRMSPHPQLLYIITRQRIAELQEEAGRRRLSETLNRDARLAAIADRKRSR
jgi:hypothetical protein